MTVANPANPLSGEEIFTGYGNARWQFETFDLSAYAGMAVLFRLISAATTPLHTRVVYR